MNSPRLPERMTLLATALLLFTVFSTFPMVGDDAVSGQGEYVTDLELEIIRGVAEIDVRPGGQLCDTVVIRIINTNVLGQTVELSVESNGLAVSYVESHTVSIGGWVDVPVTVAANPYTPTTVLDHEVTAQVTEVEGVAVDGKTRHCSFITVIEQFSRGMLQTEDFLNLTEGDTGSMNITLRNMGNGRDYFRLSVEASDKYPFKAMLERDLIAIEAGDSVNFTLTVFSPEGSGTGVRTIDVIAASLVEPGQYVKYPIIVTVEDADTVSARGIGAEAASDGPGMSGGSGQPTSDTPVGAALLLLLLAILSFILMLRWRKFAPDSNRKSFLKGTIKGRSVLSISIALIVFGFPLLAGTASGFQVSVDGEMNFDNSPFGNNGTASFSSIELIITNTDPVEETYQISVVSSRVALSYVHEVVVQAYGEERVTVLGAMPRGSSMTIESIAFSAQLIETEGIPSSSSPKGGQFQRTSGQFPAVTVLTESPVTNCTTGRMNELNFTILNYGNSRDSFRLNITNRAELEDMGFSLTMEVTQLMVKHLESKSVTIHTLFPENVTEMVTIGLCAESMLNTHHPLDPWMSNGSRILVGHPPEEPPGRPGISVETPDNDTTVSGTVEFTGGAWDGEYADPVSGVEISIDGGPWKAVTGFPVPGDDSWNHELDTTNLENGEHSVRFRSYDGTRYSLWEEMMIYVVNPVEENTPPVVILLVPGDGSMVSGTVTVSGTASDQDGNDTIESVELSHDGEEWFPVNGTVSWEFNWDTAGLNNGYYDIWARACDGQDYSEPVVWSFRVRNDGGGDDDDSDDDFLPSFDAVVLITAAAAAACLCVLYDGKGNRRK